MASCNSALPGVAPVARTARNRLLLLVVSRPLKASAVCSRSNPQWPDPNKVYAHEFPARSERGRVFTDHLQMDWALAFTAFLMGLAGAPHCAAMCGPACAALLGRCTGASPAGSAALTASSASTASLASQISVASLVSATLAPRYGAALWTFHGMRVAGYAAAGALAAAGVGLLAWAGQAAPLVRPVWTLLHVAALALGLWLALTAEQPRWMARIGRLRAGPAVAGANGTGISVASPGRGAPRAGVWAAGMAGGAWVVWPCGLLQSAVVVAGLANSPLAGAAVMAAFAVPSALGLQALPALWRWWAGLGGEKAMASARLNRLAVRLAGALLAVGSIWALGHDLLKRAWVYCFG